jgi:hypothetical protein
LFGVSSGSSKGGERERENKRECRGGGVVQSCVAVCTKRSPKTHTKNNRPKRKRVTEIGDETGDLEGQTRKKKNKANGIEKCESFVEDFHELLRKVICTSKLAQRCFFTIFSCFKKLGCGSHLIMMTMMLICSLSY